MEPIAANASRTGFECAGKSVFYLADTAWSAFTNAGLADWERYLTYRQEQGFNAVQINTLPQCDRSRPDLGVRPYLDSRFSEPNSTYWERAREMCCMAAAHGIRPVLVLLWANMVPGTWIVREVPDAANVMPFEEIARHVDRVVSYTGECQPMFFVGGDTDLVNPKTITWYEEALTSLCKVAPASLKGFHLQRGTTYLPQQFLGRLDFYTFQSGHDPAAQSRTWKLPPQFEAAGYPRRPIVNAEPCYEQMGYSRWRYGRFSASDVRSAAWSSVLSGASAGMTYGAHGIWSWCEDDSVETHESNVFDVPMRWDDALRLQGAWDFGAMPRILRSLGCTNLVPANETLLNNTERIRVSRWDGGYLAYLPVATTLHLTGLGAGPWQASALDMETKRIADLNVRLSDDGRVEVRRHPFGHDALVAIRQAE